MHAWCHHRPERRGRAVQRAVGCACAVDARILLGSELGGAQRQSVVGRAFDGTLDSTVRCTVLLVGRGLP
jgi:hypothetical protein